MRARVAVVHGPGASATLPEIVAACGDAYEPLFLLVAESDADLRLAEVARDAAPTVVLAAGDDVPSRVAATAAEHGTVGVVTFADRFAPVVDRARSVLGLPGHSADVARWRKESQRARLAAAGLFTGGWRGAKGPAALRRAVADVGFPAIVKPSLGAGSAGVVVLNGEADLAQAIDLLDPHSEFVVETYFGSGRLSQAEWLADYVSVESVSGSASRRHFGVTLRPPLAEPVRETGSVVTDLLTDDQLGRVIDAVDRALDALEARHLVTHTEVKIGPDAIEVIEVNGRLGGYVERMTQRRTETSAVRLALEAAVGEVAHAPSLRTDGCHLMSLLFPAPLDAVELLRAPERETLASLTGVWRVDGMRRPGPLDPGREGTSGYVCSIWLEAGSANALHARACEAVREIARLCLYRLRDGAVSAANSWAESFSKTRAVVSAA